MEPTRRGLMLVLSSPSGAGKTTLARRLLDAEPGVEMSISCTTREAAQGRGRGKDYHFVDRDTFARMRDRGEFLEWAVVFDNYYGTPREPVERALAEGRDVLFDVDWQGAQSLRDESAKDDVVAVFILPPSGDGARSGASMSAPRIRRRSCGGACAGQATRSSTGTTMTTSSSTTTSTSARCALRAILAAERLRASRLTGLKDFVQNLLAEL